MKLLRSYLFAPGNDRTLLDKVFRAGADAVVLDLEDAVPESEKSRARDLVAALAMNSLPPESGLTPKVFVRLNSLDSTHWRSDIDAIIRPEVFGVRVPKAEGLDALCRLDEAIGDRERSLGLPPRSVLVVATIETARGLAHLDLLAGSPRVTGFSFGAADFCADIGADPEDDHATLFARSTIVMASRNHRLQPPVASVFTRLSDDEGLRSDTGGQKRLGFFGRSAIHPRQVPIINSIFEPSAEELAKAYAVVAAFDAAEREGLGVTQTGGGFVDVAVARRARSIIGLHEQAGRTKDRK